MHRNSLCQNLSKALEMSKNTQNWFCISCIIDKNRAIYESLGRKPDCKGVKNLLLTK